MQIRNSTFFIGISFLLILLCAGVKQDDETILEGTVIDSITGRPLLFVHILNESTRRGYITDSTGNFNISCRNGDTLVFVSLGYLGRVVIADSMLEVVRLVPRTYTIEEVSIHKYRSYEQFKDDFLTIEFDKGPKIQGLPEGKPIDVPILLDTNYIHSPAFLVFHPLSYLYYNFSKEEKSKRKVFYLERRRGEQLIIDKKFNRKMVHQITGLEGDELNSFLGFCNFSHQFLYNATELEIVEKILEKFEVFESLEEKNEETRNSHTK